MMELYSWQLKEGYTPTFIWFVMGPSGVAKIQILPSYEVQVAETKGLEDSRATAVAWTADAERRGLVLGSTMYIYEESGSRFHQLFSGFDARAPVQQLLKDIHRHGHQWELSPSVADAEEPWV